MVRETKGRSESANLLQLQQRISALETELASAQDTIDSLNAPAEGGSLSAPSQPALVRAQNHALARPELAAADTYVPGPGVDAALFSRFARLWLSRVEDRYLRRHPIAAQLPMLESYFRFIRERGDDEIKVRVFVPTQERDGYVRHCTVVETGMLDQRFILDTLRLLFQEYNLVERACHHPILEIRREEGVLGDVALLNSGQGGYNKESTMHWELEPALSPDLQGELSRRIVERIGQARLVVRDFRRMLRRVSTLASDLIFSAEEFPALAGELEEIGEFLQWLRQERFVFMSYERFELHWNNDQVLPESDPRSRLGLRGDGESRGLPDAAMQWLLEPSLLYVGKKVRESVVHRTGKLDVVLVKTVDDSGQPSHVHLISGLFTRKALSEQGGTAPVLRQKLRRLLQDEAIHNDSFSQRAIQVAFNSMPIEYLFGAETADLRQVIDQIMSTEEEQEVEVFSRVDESGFSAFVLASIPRDRYNHDLKETILRHLMTQYGAIYEDNRELFGQHDNVLVYYYLTAQARLKDIDEDTLRTQIQRLARTWEEGLRQALGSRMPEDQAASLFNRFTSAFPEEYRVGFSGDSVVLDIQMLLKLEAEGRSQYRVSKDEDGYTLHIYEQHLTPLTVSLPVLSFLGFEVKSETTFELTPPNGQCAYLNVFVISTNAALPYSLLDREAQIASTLSAVFEERVENDSLNQLVLLANVDWRQVDVLRAYLNYNRQLSSQAPLDFSRRVCLTHHEAARLLLELFQARFDPDLDLSDGSARAARVDAIKERFLDRLRRVEISAEDKVLRFLFSLIEGTVRTNFYQNRPYLSFKFDPARIDHLPTPRPYREIFVHHPQIEGVHLRGGPIARGGLRWSDRYDDYRKEVLGLMTTQQVKNVVIVPVGSKGGFILKKRYADRKEERREADRLYEVFISGLLDLTDNIVDASVVPPSRLVRWDGDDPYLVVAADKGTAHLSDTANKLSLRHKFWLGDAFASGGSNGYDHKDLAITSRGAWVSVQRLFLELGRNPEKDRITCVGIGDMSGDVFGNGLLRSRTLLLMGAFNHMHIFLDPNPDPEASFLERERLFKLPGSSWEDYNPARISMGGGVFKRTAKAIEISPELQARLGTERTVLSADEVISLLLKADVDLLWNGGIGTYFKASHETNVDVGDRVNDAVRVNATEVRAKVIAEGGNLGLTMAARLEYASRGGRLNTDAVDNSGGVDCSDHEVNLKILFEPLCRRGEMSYDQRNELLERLSDEVCNLVLFDNYSQNLLISLDERRSRNNLQSFARLIEFLEQNQGLDRAFEGLPTAQELAERQAHKLGLTRPELCKLLAYTKMYVFQKLKDDPGFEGPHVEAALRAYFPSEVVEKYGRFMSDHPLRKEIAATYYSNRIVDTAGCTFFYNIWEDTSYDVTHTAFGYLLVNELLEAGSVKKQLLALEGRAPQDGIYRGLIQVEDTLGLLTRRVIRRNFDVNRPEAELARVKADFDWLRKDLSEVLPAESRAECERRSEELVQLELPEALAREVSGFPELVSGADIALLRTESGFPLQACAWLYHRIGEEVGLRRALARANSSYGEGGDWWSKSALSLLRAKLIDLQYQVSLSLCQRSTRQAGVEGLERHLTAFKQERLSVLERVRAFERRQARNPAPQGVAPIVILSSMLEELLTGYTGQ